MKSDVVSFIKETEKSYGMMRAKPALATLISKYDFYNVLDIGCGPKKHAAVFEKFNKKVTTLDMGSQYNPDILGDFLHLDNLIEDNSYDCIWASHVLEHQPNTADFLKKIKQKLKNNGILAITVPPLKHQIVGGHVSLWNMGLIFYNLVAVGFDCKDALGLYRDYDISVIIRKQDIKWDNKKIREMNLNNSTVSDGILTANGGDFYKLKQYFPKEINWHKHGNDEAFHGNLQMIGKWH